MSSAGRAATHNESTESIWLVKSGEKIDGPFTMNEINEKLRSQEIVFIDEVIAPRSRWRYVRDEPAFSAIVDEIRKGLMDAREVTEIQGITHTQTVSVDVESVTSTIDEKAPRVSEKSSPPLGSRVSDASFSHVTHPGFNQLPSNASQLGREAQKTAPIRQYALEAPLPEKPRLSKLSIGAWILAGIVLSGALYAALRVSSGKDSAVAVSRGGFEQVVSDANRAWVRGEFASALALYRQANRTHPDKPEIVSRLAPLLVQVDGQTVAAKRLLSDTLNGALHSKDPVLLSELELGLGLVALAADEAKEAEAHFRSALAVTPVSFAAGFNLGMSAFVSRSYQEAISKFSALGDDPAALVMLALSEIAQSANVKSIPRSTKKPGLRDAEAAIARVLDHHSEYRQEALLIGAFLSAETGKKQASAAHVRAALDLDPNLTDEHWKDPLLYLQPLAWRRFLPFCQRVHMELKTPHSSALLAQCLSKAGQHDQAARQLNDTLTTSPEDPVLQSLNASFLLNSGRDEDARGALRLAMRSETSRLTRIVRARLCERNDDRVCAEEAWSSLVGENPPVLASFVGLSKVRLRQGQHGEALDLLNRAQALSPRYLPAIRTRDEVRGR